MRPALSACVPVLVLAAACTGRPAQHTLAAADASLVERIDGALSAAARFLVARQDEGGAWRSQTYGVLKDGASLTPLALSALLFVPRDPTLTPVHARGAAFLASMMREVMPYPVYSLAGAALVLSVPVHRKHVAARDALIAELRAHQLTEALGWAPDEPSHGGWGDSLVPPRRPAAGAPLDDLAPSNLSATLFAVGALRLAGVTTQDPAMQRARAFVERCQDAGGDGGFFFSPAVPHRNKAGSDGRAPRSYGTMTADGLRALVATGAPLDSPRVLAATRWILEHFDAEHASGEYPPERNTDRASAYYYYAWTTAHALRLTGEGRALLVALARALLSRQGRDGAWQSPAGDLREDDPLVATPFAMAALAMARRVVTGDTGTSIEFE